MAHKGRFFPVLFARDLRLYLWNGYQYAIRYSITFAAFASGTHALPWAGQTVESADGVTDYHLGQHDWIFTLPGNPFTNDFVRIRYRVKTPLEGFVSTIDFISPDFVTTQRTFSNNLSADNKFRGAGPFLGSSNPALFNQLSYFDPTAVGY